MCSLSNENSKESKRVPNLPWIGPFPYTVRDVKENEAVDEGERPAVGELKGVADDDVAGGFVPCNEEAHDEDEEEEGCGEGEWGDHVAIADGEHAGTHGFSRLDDRGDADCDKGENCTNPADIHRHIKPTTRSCRHRT